MKSATSIMTPSTGLSCIQFPMLNVLESLIPKKKYNNTKIESGQLKSVNDLPRTARLAQTLEC